MQLRPYQQQAIENIYKSWEEYKRTLLVLPTGCGK
ncbi:MAG: DEAD/DEAH box helicase family protein, partial [Opitutales bacterium]|nr:DEAD/DEAH box helicase family protein [Opitutales bacterium]